MTWKPPRPHPRWRGRVLWIAVGMLLVITAFWGDALSAPRSAGGKDVIREYLKAI